MSWYGQKNYNDMMGGGNGGKPAAYHISQTGCFVTAFCNLLERYGKDIDPPSLNRLFTQRGIYIDVDDGVKDDLGWSSITAYDGQVHVIRTGGAGWPTSANAIVKFAYKSPKSGAATTHFCLVADPIQHTIVDSWDGIVRTPGYYGQPVAWAEYENVVPEPVIVPSPPPAAQVPASTATNGAIITLAKGDTITALALRYGVSAQEVLDHNGLSWAQARELPVGYQIRLPLAKAPTPATSGYKIELLPQPKIFHVTKAGGAQKWGFGNVKTWSDFVPNGTTPEHTNISIMAVATVIIGKESAAYYMDSVNVGDYATTGRVASTVGYNWADVTEGAYEAPPAPAEMPAPAAPPEPTPPQVDVPPVQPGPETQSPNSYKATYSPFPKPMLYLVRNAPNGVLSCPEFDGRRPDHNLKDNTPVSISGTFTKGQKLYGRPTGAKKAGYWFGVDMDYLVSQEEVFNTTVTTAEKKVMGYPMKFSERLFDAWSQAAALFTKLEAMLAKNKK